MTSQGQPVPWEAVAAEPEVQQELVLLKRQQNLQRHMLMAEYQQQQEELARRHHVQIQQRLKQLEQQREQELERRRLEQKLQQIKNKQKGQESAMASIEVKQKLQEFVLNKKKREAGSGGSSHGPPHHPRLCQMTAVHGSLDQSLPPPNGPSTSFQGMGPYDGAGDFPLRKTEPQALDDGARSSPDSPAGSVPENGTRSVLSSAPESGTSPQPAVPIERMIDPLSLLISPSMPNISLGRPANGSTGETEPLLQVAGHDKLENMSNPASLGFSLQCPFPSTSDCDGVCTPSQATLLHQHLILEQHRQALSGVGVPISTAGGDISSSVLSVGGTTRGPSERHRVLCRAQSAPLPLPPRGLQLWDSTPLPHTSLSLNATSCCPETDESLTDGPRPGKVRVKQEPCESEGDNEEPGSAEKRPRSDHISLHGQALLEQQRMQQLQLYQAQLAAAGRATGLPPRRPLIRTRSSPAYACLPQPEPARQHRFTTGLVYDTQMQKHQCSCGDNTSHPEHAGRIQSIWSRLQETGLVAKCERVRPRKASLEEVQLVHLEQYVLLYGTSTLGQHRLDKKLLGSLPQKALVMLPCGGLGVDSDTIWNEPHSGSAARLAVGCVLELAVKVATGELKNGFAVVRPPGHHAEESLAMGFCIFNSVAIAARLLQKKLHLKKILIVDWDVHHGNGTQQAFYDDASVLYISLHRYDDGNFFPGSGAPDEVGSGAGMGFTVNVAWTGGLDPPMADAEYLAAFRTVVMPVANEFGPDVVFVSAGFDAGEGHPPQLGGYSVSAKCFGHLTRRLMTLAEGRLIMALEGGHDLTAICDASEACVTALLGEPLEPISPAELQRRPHSHAVASLEKVIAMQSRYWPCVQRQAHTLGLALVEAQQCEREEAEAVTALASLTMTGRQTSTEEGHSVEEEPMEEDPTEPS
uniref:Histone deacetylase n=1 Tax=Eptatretus burgeri TaxID=7764 RepID=A0A8C4QZW1_EPTBU